MTVAVHDQENLDVFRRFLAVAPFHLVADSARLELPPKPDVSCQREGRLWYFELVRPVDPGVAEYTRGIMRSAERSPHGMAAGEAVASVPGVGFLHAIERKAAKMYPIGDAPLDLLIWIDQRADPLYARRGRTCTRTFERPSVRTIAVGTLRGSSTRRKW